MVHGRLRPDTQTRYFLGKLLMDVLETTATTGCERRRWRDEEKEGHSCTITSSKRFAMAPIWIESPQRLTAYESYSDLSELSLGKTMKTNFPNPDDILNFTLTIEPDEGMYKGGAYHFTFAINQNFPHEPPKVKCTQKIYHPNIDLEGNVCLNILREDWKPVLNLNAVIVGLQVRYRSIKASGTFLPLQNRISNQRPNLIRRRSSYSLSRTPQTHSTKKQRTI